MLHTLFCLLIILFGNGKGTFVLIHAMKTYGYWTDVCDHLHTPSTSRPGREPIEYNAAWARFCHEPSQEKSLASVKKIYRRIKTVNLGWRSFLQPSVKPLYLRCRHVTGLSARKYTFPPPLYWLQCFSARSQNCKKELFYSPCLFVRPFVLIEQLGSLWRNLYANLYCRIFRKSIEKFKLH